MMRNDYTQTIKVNTRDEARAQRAAARKEGLQPLLAEIAIGLTFVNIVVVATLIGLLLG